MTRKRAYTVELWRSTARYILAEKPDLTLTLLCDTGTGAELLALKMYPTYDHIAVNPSPETP